MHEGYMYDVFISYRHEWPVLGWFTHHFQPLLEQWLPNYMPYRPRIFKDLLIGAGTKWPAGLRQALLMSRCIVSIWSPEYFRSKWCSAELQTMLRRERLLGLRTNRNPSGLIYPVLYAGAECLPSYVQVIQYKDMSNWNFPYPVFKETVLYLEFDKQMQVLCQELAVMIQSAPPWQSAWPVVIPKISPSTTSAVPRF
jgi:hypothetical protein